MHPNTIFRKSTSIAKFACGPVCSETQAQREEPATIVNYKGDLNHLSAYWEGCLAVMGSWFALQVKHRMEFNVSAMLRAKGYEEFLPLSRSSRNGIAVPLFSRYVFCRCVPDACGRFITTPGVIRVVGFGGKPAPVSPEEIAALQLIESSRCSATAMEGLHVGDRITIEDGPLRGVCGILVSIRGQHRLLISVTIMMRTVAVEVSPDWIGRVEPAAREPRWLPGTLERENSPIQRIA